ncbi:GerAB/ArcD/ProY family transporter, partial [Tumebacillus flagellatus]|uniref:Uncharacterized protein n=1 Tax=Tumebacillus flagellatus TaxID=1157490 RepID=A0A074LND2_9BACL
MERISKRQAMWMGAGISFDATLISLPAQLMGLSRQDSWLVYLLAGAVVAVCLWMLIRVSKRFEGSDLYEALVRRFKVAGRGVVLLYTLLIFFILCRDLRMLTDFVNIQLLQKTPLMAISLLVAVTIVFIARGGIEMLGRITELYLPLLLLVVLTLPLLTAKEFEPRYFKPVLDSGIPQVLKSGWMAFGYLTEILILPFILPYKIFNMRNGLIGLGGGVFFLTLLIALDLLTLGPHIGSRFMYPNIELIRQIRITDFLDRFDIAVISIWLPSIVTKIGYGVYIVSHGLHRVFPSASAQRLTTGVGAMAMTCSMWFFENSIQLLKLNYAWPAVMAVYGVLVPLLLLLFLRPRKNQLS